MDEHFTEVYSAASLAASLPSPLGKLGFGTRLLQAGNDTDTVDGNGDGDFENDPTVIATSASPSLKAVKTYTLIDNGDQIINEGDIVRYTITVENTGNRKITGITLVDVLTNDNPTDVTSNLDGPYFTTATLGSNNGTLEIDEIATYRAFYTITEDDADSGKLINRMKSKEFLIKEFWLFTLLNV